MVVSKYKNFLTRNIFEIILFIFFILYFSLWAKFNYSTSVINTNDLDTAIKLFNYKPYLSFYLNNILISNSLKFFLGYCFFPSLVAVIIFMIFKKILSNNIWSFSLTFLSLAATENVPFRNFLVGFFEGFDLKANANLYENFEVMGFPIPSFSIFYFCLVFYLGLNIIRISKVKIFAITLLWLLMMHIHPVDGLIGNAYWISLLSILFFQKKIKFSKQNILLLFFIYLINISLVINQLTFDVLTINITQSIPLYNIFFYFILPPMLMIICILILKIDLYEFYQRFLNIYLLMFIEIILVLASTNGIGFELVMIETRISMFLLHFLYYVPVIYYLSKDEIFYVNSINKRSYSGRIVILLYYIFNKYKNIYLLTFVALIFVYFALSLKI